MHKARISGKLPVPHKTGLIFIKQIVGIQIFPQLEINIFFDHLGHNAENIYRTIIVIPYIFVLYFNGREDKLFLLIGTWEQYW